MTKPTRHELEARLDALERDETLSVEAQLLAGLKAAHGYGPTEGPTPARGDEEREDDEK